MDTQGCTIIVLGTQIVGAVSKLTGIAAKLVRVLPKLTGVLKSPPGGVGFCRGTVGTVGTVGDLVQWEFLEWEILVQWEIWYAWGKGGEVGVFSQT